MNSIARSTYSDALAAAFNRVNVVIQKRYSAQRHTGGGSDGSSHTAHLAVGDGPGNDDDTPGALQWVATGSRLSRVRVDLFVPDDCRDLVQVAAEGLRPLLTGGDPSWWASSRLDSLGR